MPLRLPPWYVLLPIALIAGSLALFVAAAFLVGAYSARQPPSSVMRLLGIAAFATIASILLGVFWASWGMPFFATGDARALGARPPRRVYASLRNWTFLPCILLVVAAGVFLVPLFFEGPSAEGKRTMALVSIALLIAALPVGAAGAWWSVILRRRVQHNARARQLCYACGYDIRINPDGPCPECGCAPDSLSPLVPSPADPPRGA